MNFLGALPAPTPKLTGAMGVGWGGGSLLVIWHKAHSTVPCRGSGKYKRLLVLAAAVTIKTGFGLNRSL